MPVTGANDDLSILYGTFEVGGTTDRPIHGEEPYRLIYTGDRVTLEYSFWVFGSSDATFITNCQAVETAFSEIRKDSTVKINGTNLLALSHTDGSGMDANPVLSKPGDSGDTIRSRRYAVSIEMQRQNSTDSSNSGRRESSVTVVFTPARRRTVTIAGEWIAGGGIKATARYNAGIAAYQTAVLNALTPTGIFDPVCEEETEANTDDTILRFRRVIDEIKFGQPTGGPVDHPAITRQSLILTQMKSAAEDGKGGNGNVKIGKGKAAGGTGSPKKGGELTRVQASYECWVRFDVVGTSGLKNLWDGTIRPAVLTRAKTFFAAGAAAVEDESVSFDLDMNRIVATMTILVASIGEVLSATLTTEDQIKKGNVLVPVLTSKRNPYTKYPMRGPGQILRIVTETISLAQSTFTPPFTDFTPKEVVDPTGDAAGPVSVGAIMDVTETRSKRNLGIDGSTIEVHDYTCVTQIEYFDPYGGGTIAGGGSSNKLG